MERKTDHAKGEQRGQARQVRAAARGQWRARAHPARLAAERGGHVRAVGGARAQRVALVHDHALPVHAQDPRQARYHGAGAHALARRPNVLAVALANALEPCDKGVCWPERTQNRRPRTVTERRRGERAVRHNDNVAPGQGARIGELNGAAGGEHLDVERVVLEVLQNGNPLRVFF